MAVVVQVPGRGAADGLLGHVGHGAAHGELHETAQGLEGEPQPHGATSALAVTHQLTCGHKSVKV